MMRPKYRVSTIWIIVAALSLVLGAAETCYWYISAERLRSGYQAWLGAQGLHGWEIASGPVSIGGWPLTATVSVPNLTLRHAGSANVNVASASVTLAISLFDPMVLDISLTGPAHIRAGKLPDLVVTGDAPSVSVPLRPAGSVLVALHASALRVEAASGAWHVSIGLLNAQADVATEASADLSRPAAKFALSSEAIALPAGFKWPLGPNISSFSVDGTLNGNLPDTRDITQWAEAWRDGGGSLEITHMALGWGPLGLTSSATLALDDQLQPMGSGNGRIVGYAQTLDRLAAGGMLTKSAAIAAKAVLSLMAGTSDVDEQSSVDVPLTLQYRTLSMRQVPLVRLPELDWPGR